STRSPSIVATLDSNRLPVELEVSDIGVSPASTEIAIASLDSLNLFVWDWNTDKLEKFYHRGAVIRLSWHPSGTHVAVACADGAAYIHDLSDSGERESVRQAVQDGRQIPVGDGQPIDIQFSRRGDLLLILTTNGELRCQNWSTGDIVVANTPVTFASKIAISDRGDLIAVSDPSADIFWRFDSGEAYRELKLTPASTRSDANLAQLGSGPLFAVVYDHAIYIVDINSNRVAAKTRVPDATSVAFDGGRDRLIASSMNGAHQWHCPLTGLVGNLHLQQLTNLPLPDALRHMAISGDGSTVAFGHTSKVVTCGLANDDEYRVIETGSLVGELQLDHTGRWVAGIHVPSGEGFLIDGEAIRAEPANLGLAEHHAFLELGGRKTLVVARPDGIRAIAIDDLDTQLWNWQADSPPTALSVRGENIAIGHADGGLTMLDSISGIPIVRIPTSGSPIASLALDSVGTHLLAINEEGRLHTWHLVHALAAAQPRAVQTITRYPDADARAGVVPSPTLVHWTSGSFTEPLQAKLRNLIAADDKVADSPADPERRYRRGRAYHDLARIRSAEKDYQHCFKLLDGAKPDYAAGAYFYWARTWIDDRQQGWNPAEATNLIARSLALDPKNADSLFVSAFARYYCGDYEPALLDISRSIELDRGFNFPIKLYCKAGCLYALGELDEAQDLCAQASNLLSKAEPYAVPSFNELAKEIEILCNHQRRRSIPD
ncbi:MAG: hypothetical protein O3C21_18415, partial [Verrucomicrobia bacterium]|nr:hypothetical protein [Verrucomicrobiota bacterium]